MYELHSSYPLIAYIDTNEMPSMCPVIAQLVERRTVEVVVILWSMSGDSSVGRAEDCRGRSDPLVDGSNPPRRIMLRAAPSSSSIAPSSSE